MLLLPPILRCGQVHFQRLAKMLGYLLNELYEQHGAHALWVKIKLRSKKAIYIPYSLFCLIWKAAHTFSMSELKCLIWKAARTFSVLYLDRIRCSNCNHVPQGGTTHPSTSNKCLTLVLQVMLQLLCNSWQELQQRRLCIPGWHLQRAEVGREPWRTLQAAAQQRSWCRFDLFSPALHTLSCNTCA